MKKNKIFILALLAFLLFTFVGCGSSKEELAAFEDAHAYFKGVYKDAESQTLDDYEVISKVKIGDVTYPIKWSVTIKTGDADTVKVVEREGQSTLIDIDKYAAVECTYTLKGVISDDNGNSAEEVFEKTKPAYVLNTYAEYRAAEVGDALNVKGVLTAKFFNATSKMANLYFQDADGGYYGYNITTTQEQFDAATIGSTIIVSGVKDLYSGTYEVKEGTFEILDDAVAPIAPQDVTEMYVAATVSTDAELAKLQSQYVTIKGVDMVGINDKYLEFTLDDVKSYVYLSGSSCMVDSAGQETLKGKTVAGNYANVTGIVAQYSGAFYLLPIDVDSIDLQTRPEKSDAEKVADAKEKVEELDGTTYYGDVELVTNTGYESVSIAWTSGDTTVAANDGTKVAYPLEGGEVEFTAVITSGEVSETVKIKVKVYGLEKSTIASLKNVYADEETVWLEGKIIGTDAKGQYFFIADETGVAYIYNAKLTDLEGIEVGDSVKVVGATTLYCGSKTNQFTREVMASSVTELETAVTPIEAVPLDLADIAVNPYAEQTALSEADIAALVANNFQGELYEITGYIRVKTSGSYTNIYICVENNDEAACALYHYSSAFQEEIKAYDGKLVTIVAPMFDYSIQYGWRVGPYVSIAEVTAAPTLPTATHTVAEVCAAEKDTAVQILGTITHVYAGNGITVKDATGAIYVYNKSLPTTLNVGDVVLVSGAQGSYNSAAQITGTVEVEVVKATNYVFTPTTMTAEEVKALDSAVATNFGREISTTGKLVKSGNYTNFELSDGTVLSAYMSSAEAASAADLIDVEITVTIITYNYKNNLFQIFVALDTAVVKATE